MMPASFQDIEEALEVGIGVGMGVINRMADACLRGDSICRDCCAAWRRDAPRAYARRRNLPVADKPDSQEICFIPDNDYAKFVTAHAPQTADARGAIVDEDGRVKAERCSFPQVRVQMGCRS